jgi:inorganic phosphate transporter, PiT family
MILWFAPMHLFGLTIPFWTAVLLFLAVGLALAFEFVNGFHDTANAVATVIYTHALPPMVAVVWSGCWNFIGVLVSSGAVAFSVVSLLPVELVINVGSAAGFAMVFALLVSAIIWNLGTWYLGLPASSSHTLIGSILGVGLANSMMDHGASFGEGVNWGSAYAVGLSLLISPIIGFVASALLLLTTKACIRRPELFRAPVGKNPPPGWIRGLLVLTCTGVSFAHGSNDGQKGMGLILLILVGIVPGAFALKMDAPSADLSQIAASAGDLADYFAKHAARAAAAAPAPPPAASPSLPANASATDLISDYVEHESVPSAAAYAALAEVARDTATRLRGATTLAQLPEAQRVQLRSDFYLLSAAIGKLVDTGEFKHDQRREDAAQFRADVNELSKFIPLWVKIAVALALGCGTMVGWKRIVVTVGEKIGKEHLTYAQGACAELVAFATILAADQLGLPVSTTHVLSSGVAGTMAANHSGLQSRTLRNILLAWVLTLPATVFLGAMLFACALNVVALLGLR